jgi:hypothetical protein
MTDSLQSGRLANPVLKSDADGDVIAAVQKIEAAADQCYRPLALLRLPANIAIWSLLTCLIVEHTEKHLSGPTTFEFTNSLSNASRAIGTAINWVSKHGRPPSRLANRRWTPAIRESSLVALREAHNYEAFRNTLPVWHEHRFAVTAVTRALAAFQIHGEGARHRQVLAYLNFI